MAMYVVAVVVCVCAPVRACMHVVCVLCVGMHVHVCVRRTCVSCYSVACHIEGPSQRPKLNWREWQKSKDSMHKSWPSEGEAITCTYAVDTAAHASFCM